MSLEKIQIKELSTSGELLSVLTCHAGQITVLRSVNNSDLAKYLRAFAGISGKEKFSLSVNDLPFVPKAHNLIGFGESFSIEQSNQTPTEFLKIHGLPEHAIPASLAQIGLDSRATIPGKDLTQDEERRLRLFAATFQPEKALIVNDPFDCLSSAWRERFAEILVQFVKGKNGLVIVPLLTYRPEAWIDNERVARLQVGENVQRTIGYSSSPSSVHSIIEKVRDEASNKEPTSKSRSEGQEQHLNWSHDLMQEQGSSNAQFNKVHYLVPILATLGLIVIGVLLGTNLVRLKNFPDGNQELSKAQSSTEGEQEDKRQVRLNSNNSAKIGLPETSDQKLPINQVTHSNGLPKNLNSTTTQVEAKPVAVKLLDRYPQEIRLSIIESFEGVPEQVSENKIYSPRVSRDQPKKTGRIDSKKTSPSELLTVLETTSSTGLDQPSLNSKVRAPQSNIQTDHQLQNLPPEERREVIRQRFLDAIRRASEQQS